jgi:putative ABC transport system substrate-binding protein
MRHRTPDVLLLATVLTASLLWSPQGAAQTKVVRAGVLTFFSPTSTEPLPKRWWEPFRRSLAQQGWIEGKTLSLEFRSAPADPQQLARAAAELVALKVDIIWALGAPYTRAAHAATDTIPIVAVDFTSDPVAEGYAESYGRPGRNVTGVFLDAPEFAGKWLEVLQATVPRLLRIAVMWDPSAGTAHLRGVQSVARGLGLQLQVLEVRNPAEIDRAFLALRGKPQALIVLPSPMLFAQSARVAELALKYRLPATSMTPHLFVEAGGLIGYGPDDAAAAERSAAIIAKILGGTKPGDLPIERPTMFKFLLNLKTARALGLTIPSSVLVRVDEVIQ